MKIAVLFDNLGPYHMSRLEAASRVGTLLAIQVNERSADYAWEPPLHRRRFKIATLNASPISDQLRAKTQNDRLRFVLGQFAPDCVFIPGWSRSYSLTALGWCRLHEVPAVLMSETTEWDKHRPGYKEWLKTQLVGMFSAALVGGAPQADYLTRLGMAPDRIFQGYDAVDNAYFHQGAELARARSAQLRNEFFLPEQYFLASARFIERKNLVRLIRAYSSYVAMIQGAKAIAGSVRRDPFSLVLLGDGQARTVVENVIKELQLGRYVHLPGFRQYAELPVYYGLASAFIHASVAEPWGLVVNEAMASGLPVLVSNRCGCAPDLLREGDNGFTFDPYDVSQITNLMVRLSAGGELKRMGQMSSQQIRKWGPENFAEGVRKSAEKAYSHRWRMQSSFPDTVLQLVFGP